MPTVDSVKEVEVKESWQGPPSAENEPLCLYSVETIPVEPQVDGYPFSDQSIFKGDFSYKKKTVLGVDKAKGTFQIRMGSGIFILRKESGSANTNKLLEAFNNAVNGQFEIHDTNILSRPGLWRFIQSAEGPVDVTVLHPTGDEKTLDELREEGEENLTITDLADREYPIVSADVIFRPSKEESVHVQYDRSSLSISAPTEDAHEYFVQKFERDVIGPSKTES
jgi:hypothetical protein